MEKTNNIHAFFAILALLFWNPLTFYLMYRDTPAYEAWPVHLLYWLVFLAGLYLWYGLRKKRWAEKVKDIALQFSLAGILFAVVVTINIFLKLPENPAEKDLIYPPHSSAHYQTVEFDYVADIDSLGLRDKEVALQKGGKYRILCFGDSWTFGWGVNIENSWPRKLEKWLRANGPGSVEVINCGQGGQYTTTYLKYMERIVPLLQPDLVLVGVLQGDDLAQLYENHFDETAHEAARVSFFQALKQAAKAYLRASLGNILARLSGKSNAQVEIKPNWESSSNYLIGNFNYLQSIRFQTLEDTVQKLFKSGDLNPGLLGYYIDFPDRMTIFNNPAHPATQLAAEALHRDLKGMKQICQKHNAGLVFVNMPINYFTGHQVVRTPSDVLNPYFEKNNKIDSIYAAAAADHGLPYIQMTEHFISLEDKTKYFYRYDGHPTATGYEEIANYIGRALLERNLIPL